MCKTLKVRADYLENLFSVSTSYAAGGVDLDLTLRFPDHVALRGGRRTSVKVVHLNLT